MIVRSNTVTPKQGGTSMGTKSKLLAAIGAAAALAGGAVGVAKGVSGSSDDVRATGPEADKAKAAALKAVGGGRVVSVEREDEARSAWEVEVVRRDGTEVEASLDSAYKPVAVERDDDGARDDDALEADDD
jgi:hypothetical protein